MCMLRAEKHPASFNWALKEGNAVRSPVLIRC
jgi:hypothetical protein